jgi:hypothetical protein
LGVGTESQGIAERPENPATEDAQKCRSWIRRTSPTSPIRDFIATSMVENTISDMNSTGLDGQTFFTGWQKFQVKEN